MEPIELSITEVTRPTTKQAKPEAKPEAKEAKPEAKPEAKEAKPKARRIPLATGMFRRMYGFLR